MTNNLQVKDANNVTKEIHTIEDSTSAHYNMSIPITVSGVPIFTTAAPGVVSLADSLVKVSISPSQAPVPVSVVNDATVSVRAGFLGQVGIVGAASIGGGSAQIGRVSVFVDNVPFNVSINNALPVHVSLAGGPTFSTPGADDLSPGLRTLYVTNFNYVYDSAGNNWDRWDGKVSIGNTVPVPVSVVGGRVSIQGSVSISPQTINVNVCNALPAAGATQLVSVGGVVSTQGVQIVGRDINGDARTPRMHTDGSLIVHISAGAVGGAGGDVSVSPTQGSIPVSVAPFVFNLPVSVHPVTQSGTWNISALTSINSTIRVSVANIADVSIQDNAPVSVRGGVLGSVSLGGGSAQIGSVVVAAGTNLIGGVSVRQVVSVQPDGTQNWPVSITPLTFNLPVSVHPVTQSGTWNVGLNAGTNLVGAVSVRQVVSVVPDGTGPNFPVSIAPPTFNIPVSIAAGRVSVQGIADVSISPNGLNIPVSVAGGRVSVQGLVTVDAKSNTGAAVPAGAFFVGGTDGTNLRGLLTDTAGRLVVHVSNTAPGGSGAGSPQVSIGGAVSVQATQIAVRDTAGDARTPLANTGGNLLVHVCNALPTPTGITQLVSIAGPVSTQAVQVAFTDGTNARTPLTNTGGNILVHVCNAAPGAAGGSSITTSIGGPVSVQAVPIAGVDTGGNVRQPLMTTGGALIVHVSNTAPGGSSGGGSPQVSVGGTVSVQGNQVVGVDEDGLARTLHVNTSGVQYISTRTFMTQAVFTRPADTTAYAAGATAAPGNAGDLIANSTTAGSVVPLKFKVSRGNNGVAYIRGARLYRTGGTLATGQHNITGNIRLHLFNAASGVSVVNGDNGAFLASPVSNWMGYIDLTAIASAPGLRTSGAVSVQVYWGAPARTGEMIVPLAPTQVSIQGLLETRIAFTPIASEVFTVQLDGFNG